MSKKQKILRRIISKPKDLRFSELETLLVLCGYSFERSRGSHAIFSKEGKRPITVPIKSPVKSYLLEQVLDILEDEIETLL